MFCAGEDKSNWQHYWTEKKVLLIFPLFYNRLKYRSKCDDGWMNKNRKRDKNNKKNWRIKSKVISYCAFREWKKRLSDICLIAHNRKLHCYCYFVLNYPRLLSPSLFFLLSPSLSISFSFYVMAFVLLTDNLFKSFSPSPLTPVTWWSLQSLKFKELLW